MDNVQNCDSYINIALPKAYKTYLKISSPFAASLLANIYLRLSKNALLFLIV
jgi:hypothetical protein